MVGEAGTRSKHKQGRVVDIDFGYGLLYDFGDKHSDISFVSFLANNCNHATTRVCAFIFAVVVFAMSVPDIAALLYGTLTAEEMFSPRAAKFWSFVMPFLVSWGCYHTHALSAVISRGGMALAAPTNLLIPMLVSLKALDVVFFKNPLSSSEGGRQQGAFRVAGKSDIFDSANRRTVVRPLPYGLHRYQRLIGSMLFCVTIGGLITCVVLSLRCVMARGLALRLSLQSSVGTKQMAGNHYECMKKVR